MHREAKLVLCLVLLVTFMSVIYFIVSTQNAEEHNRIENILIIQKDFNGEGTTTLTIANEDQNDPNIEINSNKTNETNPVRIPPKTFIYLVQAPNCLPELLQGEDYIGSSDTCDCDVIVYSYQFECTSVNHLHHVQYIFDPSENTWTKGRNLLYRTAKSRSVDYLYYFFIDDDIYLEYDQTFGSLAKNRSIPPLRAFEQFLLEYEPAIGVGNYYFHHTARNIMDFIDNSCHNNVHSNHSSSISPLYLTIAFFDPCFNAFHRDVLDHLLPYNPVRDNVDWWASNSLLVMKVELLYRGHAVMYTPIFVGNPLHRSYPKDMTGFSEDKMTYCHQLVAELPTQFQNVDWVQQSFLVDSQYIETTRTLCYLFPAHHPIKIYSHFDLDWTV